jgi:hypothetical protein
LRRYEEQDDEDDPCHEKIPGEHVLKNPKKGPAEKNCPDEKEEYPDIPSHFLLHLFINVTFLHGRGKNSMQKQMNKKINPLK